jgi:hypothetical protein
MAWQKMQVRGPNARYAYVQQFRAITTPKVWGPFLIFNFIIFQIIMNNHEEGGVPLLLRKPMSWLELGLGGGGGFFVL